jgi:hypothetical protein
MSVRSAGGQRIVRRLQESLAQLRDDIDRVELWAGALEVFSQPIPDYEPGRDHKLPRDNHRRPPKSGSAF